VNVGKLKNMDIHIMILVNFDIDNTGLVNVNIIYDIFNLINELLLLNTIICIIYLNYFYFILQNVVNH
jgi:hypothetical protein